MKRKKSPVNFESKCSIKIRRATQAEIVTNLVQYMYANNFDKLFDEYYIMSNILNYIQDIYVAYTLMVGELHNRLDGKIQQCCNFFINAYHRYIDINKFYIPNWFDTKRVIEFRSKFMELLSGGVVAQYYCKFNFTHIPGIKSENICVKAMEEANTQSLALFPKILQAAGCRLPLDIIGICLEYAYMEVEVSGLSNFLNF